MKAHTYLTSLAAAAVVALALLTSIGGTGGAMAAEGGETLDAAHSLSYQDAGDDDDGPEIGRLAFLTVAASAAAALLGLIGYAIRRAVGYEPHRPGPEDEQPHH